MTNELKELQASNMALLNLLADIRAAVGDDGKRMQEELVQFLRELKEERDALQPAAAPVDDQEPAAYLHRMEKHTELSFFGESAECTGRSDWIGFVPLFTRANTRYPAMLNEQPASTPSSFEREERYLVIKISKLNPDPETRAAQAAAIRAFYGDALVDCVVVEADWPEYEPTWRTIEARVTGVAQP